jgi:uncharacterized protein (PEP-CTERM system associated)
VLGALVCAAWSGVAEAQVFQITPFFGAELTWTDNVNLTSTNPESDTLLTLSPGISFAANGRHVRGYLRYSADVTYSLTDSDRRGINHNLTLGGGGDEGWRINWIDGLLYTDLRAGAGVTQDIPVGAGVPSGGLDSANASQTWNFSATTVAGRDLGGEGSWEARHTLSAGGSASELFEGGYSNAVRVAADRRIGDSKVFAGFRYDYQDTLFEENPRYSTSRVVGSLRYQANRALSVYAYAGYGWTEDLIVLVDGRPRDSGVSYGVGGTWNPQSRTYLSGRYGESWFGRDYEFSLRYRAPQWSVTGYARRGVENNLSTLFLPSNTDLVNFLDFSLQGRIPDEAERQRAVNEFLARRGLTNVLDAPQTITTDRPYVITTGGIRGGVFGARNSVFVGLTREQRDIAQTGDAVFDAGNPPFKYLDESATLGWSYLPGQATAFTTTLEWRRSREELTGAQTEGIEFSTIARRRIGRSWSGSLEYRFRDYNGENGGATYTENAVIGTLTYFFR